MRKPYLAVLATLFACASFWGGVAQNPQQPAPATQLVLLHVEVNQPGDIDLLIALGYDVLEARGKNFVQVIANNADEKQLRERGFTLERVRVLSTPSSQNNTETFFGCYRTVAEHYAHLDARAAAHPNLAKVVDYGDSYLKLQGSPNRHDLRAICITHQRTNSCSLNPNSGKPRFVIMAAIHARELSTSEMVWRWMDFLIDRMANWALLLPRSRLDQATVCAAMQTRRRVWRERRGCAKCTSNCWRTVIHQHSAATGWHSPAHARSRWRIR